MRGGGIQTLDHSSYYLNIIYSFISFFHFQAMCLFIQWISCVVGSCFDFFPPHFANLCLLFALFNSFTLCVITEMVILMSGIMLFVFYMFYVVFVHLFLDYYKFGIRYFFIYHLNFRVCVCVCDMIFKFISSEADVYVIISIWVCNSPVQINTNLISIVYKTLTQYTSLPSPLLCIIIVMKIISCILCHS